MKTTFIKSTKNRQDNVVWTISKNYDILPDYRLFNFEDDEKINFYKTALTGFSYEHFQMNKIYDFLNYLIDENLGSKDYIKLVELILEEYFWDIYEEQRPGIVEYRNYTMNKKYAELMLSPSEELYQELELAYYARKKTSKLKTIKLVKSLVDEIINIDKFMNTDSFILKLEYLMKKYFYINSDFNYDELSSKSISDKNNEESNTESSQKIFLNKKEDSCILEEEVESSEFNNNSFIFNILDSGNIEECDTLNINNNCNNFKSFKYLAEEVYGKSIIHPSINRKMEDSLCTGIHEGVEILITKGEYGDSFNELYRISEKKLNTELNEKYYNDNILVHKRSISKLKDIIQKEILTDLEESKYLTNKGILIPSLLWKYEFLNNDKVFYRQIQDELGSISVDILLDSSASQFERQELVAAQGYIISQALTELNIPTRVISFNNFYNVLVLQVFRDYFDPPSKNKNIFEYTASSSNRDGIAIKTMRYLIEKFNSQRKILIILSDGKPNDKISLRIINKTENIAKDYIKNEAIKDTAKEVFLTRNAEITILGVFTGEVEDLPDEKRIFGTDFAYIHDTNRFSEIVGRFLTTVFRNSI